jgi:hypothetical protein
MEQVLTVHEMLERWGLRVTGGTLKNPIRTSTGGDPLPDDDLALVSYIRGTEGYDRAAPILSHRYSLGLPSGRFRVRNPGETLARALMRLGWFDLAGLPEREIPRRVLREFRDALADRMRSDPYRPPSALPPLPVGLVAGHT